MMFGVLLLLVSLLSCMQMMSALVLLASCSSSVILFCIPFMLSWMILSVFLFVVLEEREGEGVVVGFCVVV